MTVIDKEGLSKIKVDVYLFSDERIQGYLYLRNGERLQDLMNDSREFIPLLKIDVTIDYKGTYPTVVISKQAIARLEER